MRNVRWLSEIYFCVMVKHFLQPSIGTTRDLKFVDKYLTVFSGVLVGVILRVYRSYV